MAIRLEPVDFIGDDDFNSLHIVRRVVYSISRKSHSSHLMGIFGTRGSGCTSILNMCKDFATKNPHTKDRKRTLWLKPFDSWKMAGMGNLMQALLWHVHCNLPESVASDEKVLYKLGRLSVALSARYGQSMTPGYTQVSQVETERNYELISKTLSPERKSSVSSQFSACEQIVELSAAFGALGRQLAGMCGCDALVIPIDNLDRCTPGEAMELLFALKMMIDGDSFSFVVTGDDSILSQFRNFIYGGIFTDKQAVDSMFAFFDDWVRVPSPSLQTVLRKVDFPVSQKDSFFKLLDTTGFQTMFPQTGSILQGCKRFELFMYSEAMGAARTTKEYCSLLGWFLINETLPEKVQEIILNVNSEEFLNRFIHVSQQEKSTDVATGEAKETISGIVIRQRKQQSHQSAVSLSYVNASDSVLSLYVNSMSRLMSTKELVGRLKEVYPFL